MVIVVWINYFDSFFVVAHNDGSERRIFRVNLTVINGPKTVELQHLFVPAIGRPRQKLRIEILMILSKYVPFRHFLHVHVWLITNHMVDEI